MHALAKRRTRHARFYCRTQIRSTEQKARRATSAAMSSAIWFVSIEEPGLRAEWSWDALGAPDPRDLLQTRRPRSGDFSRHMPRGARSITTGGILWLESGLEHDLVRWADRRADVTWLVAQPAMLHFPVAGRRRSITHTPDLLTNQADGSVTVWDVRPDARQDELFAKKADLTRSECERRGWRYEVFSGLPVATRMNLLWVAGYRRSMPWHDACTQELEAIARGGSSVRDVLTLDDGSGELVATMWHLIWSGRLVCDLDDPITSTTPLMWSDLVPGAVN